MAVRSRLQEDAMPGNCHPAYAHIADELRPGLRPFAKRTRVGDGTVTVAFQPPMAYLRAAASKDSYIKTRNLRRRNAAGPAPFVGRPFVYWWHAYIDEYGRAIGPAIEDVEIVYTDTEDEECNGL